MIKLNVEQVKKIDESDCVYLTSFTSKGNVRFQKWVLLDWSYNNESFWFRTNKGNKINKDIAYYDEDWDICICDEMYSVITSR